MLACALTELVNVLKDSRILHWKLCIQISVKVKNCYFQDIFSI